MELLYKKLGVDRELDLKLSYLPDPLGFPLIVIENYYFLESYLIDDVSTKRLKNLYVELVRKEENFRLNEFDSNDNSLYNEEHKHHGGEHDLFNEKERHYGGEQGGEIQDDYFDRQFVVDVVSNPDGECDILGEMSHNLKTTASPPTLKRTNPSGRASVDIDNPKSVHLDMFDIDTFGTALVEYTSASYSFTDGSNLAIGQEFASKFELQKMQNEIVL